MAPMAIRAAAQAGKPVFWGAGAAMGVLWVLVLQGKEQMAGKGVEDVSRRDLMGR